MLELLKHIFSCALQMHWRCKSMRRMALRCSMVMAHGGPEPHTTGAPLRRLQVWPVTVHMLTWGDFLSLATSGCYWHLPPLVPVLLPTYL